jgi:hypothetical protein
MHPFASGLSSLSDQELDNKIIELTKKYYQSLRYSPSIASQVVLLLSTYKTEQQDRAIAKSKKVSENGEDDINELIKID